MQARNLTNKAKLVWQVILWLSRYGGLRTPSETLSLRWEDIDWEMNRMIIPEPKVEHHEGLGIRSCPNFPELRPILDKAFEIFGDKSEYVVAAPQYRAAANGNRHIPCAVRMGLTAYGVCLLLSHRCFGLATIVPLDACQQTNRTPARVSASRRLFLARQFTTDRTAELSVGYRG